MCLRAERSASSLTNRAQDDGRDGPALRHTARDRLPQVQLVQRGWSARRIQAADNAFAADSPWQKMGTDVTEFKCSFGKGRLAPAYDFSSGGTPAWSISESPNAQRGAGRDAPTCSSAGARRRSSGDTQSDMGWQYRNRQVREMSCAARATSCRHVAQKLPGQRACAEGLFRTMKLVFEGCDGFSGLTTKGLGHPVQLDTAPRQEARLMRIGISPARWRHSRGFN